MKARKLNSRAVGLSMVIALVTAILYLSPLGSILEERVGLDTLFVLRGPIDPPDNVFVVAMNNRSSRELGYPNDPDRWPRSIHAKLIDKVTDAGATAISFDLIFDQPDEIPDEDVALAASIKGSGRVVLFKRREHNLNAVVIHDYPPLSEFTAGAAAFAPFTLPRLSNRVSQLDWFVRDTYHMPILPVATFLIHASDTFGKWTEIGEEIGAYVIGKPSPEEVGLTGAEMFADAVHAIREAALKNPDIITDLRTLLEDRARTFADTDRELEAMAMVENVIDVFTGPRTRVINIYGAPGKIKTIPYDAVINGPTPGDDPLPDFKGSAVFVGYSELDVPDNVDDFFTPYKSAGGISFSGVEIAATTFGNLVTGATIQQVPSMDGSGLVFLLCAGAAIFAFHNSVRSSVPVVIAMGLGYLLVSQMLFNWHQVWLPVATPLLVGLPLALFGGILWQNHRVRAEKMDAELHRENLAKLIRRLVPAQAPGLEEVDQNLLNQPDTKYVVCLATDAVSSTRLHAKQESETSFEFQNEYFKALSRSLKTYRPDFREFHADGSLFSWNVEDTNGIAKEQACFAAIAALDAIDAFNRDVAPAKLGIRIGLHAGNVSFGFIGDEDRVVYRGIGSTINATSRVEGINKFLKTRLLATQPVVSGLDSLLLRPLGQFLLVGLDTPMDLFEVRGASSTATAENMELCLRFAEAIDAFQRHEWGHAAKRAAAIQRDFREDGPSEFLERECRVRMEADSNDIRASIFEMATK